MKRPVIIRQAGGGHVELLSGGTYRLSLPKGDRPGYRLAELDDSGSLRRSLRAQRPPGCLEIRARVSAQNLPGTWGFGFWNEPFEFGNPLVWGNRILPALPQCTWFFHASPPNFLSIYEDVPGRGFFAGAIRAASIPTWIFTPLLPALPLLLWPAAARLVRKLGRVFVKQEGLSVDVDVTAWHAYRVEWLNEESVYSVDGEVILTSRLSPRPPLGIVIWIDNQYAAFTPQGKVGMGTLATPDCWLDIAFEDR